MTRCEVCGRFETPAEGGAPSSQCSQAFFNPVKNRWEHWTANGRLLYVRTFDQYHWRLSR